MAYHTSLLTATDCRGHVHLVVGTNPLAAARCAQSLAAGATPILIAPEEKDDGDSMHYALRRRVEAREVRWVREPFADAHLFSLGRAEVAGVVDAVFVTSRDLATAQHISEVCRRNRIPVNVVDAPRLCSFSLLSVHTDGPLQIGVTTNGHGCKLASRIRREVAAALPAGLGAACARLGEARRRIIQEDLARDGSVGAGKTHVPPAAEEDDAMVDDSVDDSYDQTASFNRLVISPENSSSASAAAAAAAAEAAALSKSRRMRWLAQVCEYWPLKRIAATTDAEVDEVLQSYRGTATNADTDSGDLSTNMNTHNPNNSPRQGRIILAGAGPGHPDLLTRATLRAIASADLVLADKLVPQGVLDLVPRRAEVRIARKFPGNADAAQEELLLAALAGARSGKNVLRLKQGDPFVYGRGGEEVAYFRAAGFDESGGKLVVLPGITSALSAPLFAGIPPTQRDVADQILICTGTGKKGRPPAPPGYRPGRTVVFLMALHRLAGLVGELTAHTAEEDREEKEEDQKEGDDRVQYRPRRRRLWPLDTPCAVVERASCPDQKVIRTTLAHVVQAVEQEGSRPPGLLVVGAACEALHAPPPPLGEGGAESPGNGRAWVVEDGFKGLDDLDGEFGGMFLPPVAVAQRIAAEVV